MVLGTNNYLADRYYQGYLVCFRYMFLSYFTSVKAPTHRKLLIVDSIIIDNNIIVNIIVNILIIIDNNTGRYI